MNRFILSTNPAEAAKFHNDKHVVKMILEEAQMLSTSHHLLNENMSEQISQSIYRPTHKNHPCSVWVRESRSNYNWAYALFQELCNEYTFRYGKVHKSWSLSPFLKDAPFLLDDKGLTPFPQAMPDHCKNENAVLAYRTYYLMEKTSIANWTNRTVPSWWEAGISIS